MNALGGFISRKELIWNRSKRRLRRKRATRTGRHLLLLWKWDRIDKSSRAHEKRNGTTAKEQEENPKKFIDFGSPRPDDVARTRLRPTRGAESYRTPWSEIVLEVPHADSFYLVCACCSMWNHMHKGTKRRWEQKKPSHSSKRHKKLW